MITTVEEGIARYRNYLAQMVTVLNHHAQRSSRAKFKSLAQCSDVFESRGEDYGCTGIEATLRGMSFALGLTREEQELIERKILSSLNKRKLGKVRRR